jgi:hypothetical protein
VFYGAAAVALVALIATLTVAWWFWPRVATVRNLKPGQSCYLPPWVFYKHGGRVYVFGDAEVASERNGTFQIQVVRGDAGLVCDVDLEYVQQGQKQNKDRHVIVR